MDTKANLLHLSGAPALLDILGDAVLAVDASQRIIVWNRAAEDLYGWPREEALGRPVTEVLPSGVDLEARARALTVLDRGGTVRMEVVQETRGGRRINVEGRILPLTDEEGRLTGYICANRELPEDRRTRRELEKRVRQLREAQEITHIGSWELDLRTGTIEWSDEIFRIFGLPVTRDAVSYDDFIARVHPDDRERLLRVGDVISDGRNSFSEEYRVVRPDGTVRRVIDSGRIHLDESGNPVRRVGTVQDITRQRATEDALRVSEDRLRAILVNAPVVIFALDSSGVFTLSAGAGLSGTGLAEQELVGSSAHVVFRDLDAVLSDGTVVKGTTLVDRVLAGETCEALTSWGGRQYENRLGPSRDLRGSITGMVGVAVDVTERVTAEAGRQDLLAREQQARAEAESASDRLRTLSRKLIDLQETERRRVARELHDDIGQLVTGIKLLVEREVDLPAAGSPARDEMKSLLTELLRRIRTMSLSLRPGVLDDLGLVPALLWHLERFTSQSGVRVEFHHRGLDGRFPSELELAAFRIVQEALTNVARHAAVSEAAVSVVRTDGVLEIDVMDQGRGFRPEEALTGDSSGLAGMQERAQLLQGWVRVRSAPGKGTRITARLPLRPGVRHG